MEETNWNTLSETESHEFVHIWSHLSSYLNVDIALDDDGQYKVNLHPLCIYFRNGYNNGQEEWLPLLVSDTECRVPLTSYSLNISDCDFRSLCEFVKMYYNEIKELADRRLNFTQFIDQINNGRFRLIIDGILLTTIPFDFVSPFSNDKGVEKAFIRIGNQCGCIDKEGKIETI